MADHKNKARASVRPLNFRTLALTTAGLGFLRPAPGTWGSVPPVAIAALMFSLGVALPVAAGVTTGLLLAACVTCVAFGVYAESRFGRKDAAEVVADETAGVCLPVLAVILGQADSPERWWALAGAFVLFRLFDIAKPWPMPRLERLPFGWGVLLDDLVAGVYAAVLIIVITGLWHSAF